MSRPRKCRRICCIPGNKRFGPMDDAGEEQNTVAMTVDEFESIRLIDLERLSQVECASRMNVGRATVQAIYASARMKIAQFMVNGMELSISGGDFILCEGKNSDCRHSARRKSRCRFGDEEKI